MTDCELGQRIANGDAAAFQVFFDRHYEWIFRRALRILKSHCDAEDAVSDVFVKIWQNREKFDSQGKSTFMAWVNVLAQRKIIDALRIKNRNRIHNRHGDLLHIEDYALLGQVADNAPDGLQQVIADEITERIESALLEVQKANHRIAWILHYFEGYTYNEISGILKKPVGSCKIWIHRCSQRLRELLTEDSTQQV